MIKENNTLDVAWSHIQPKKQGHKKSMGNEEVGQNLKKGWYKQYKGVFKKWGVGIRSPLPIMLEDLNNLKITGLTIC